MTNEEAIKILTEISDYETQALDLAIKALEQQQRDCKTCKHSDTGNCAGTEECHECMWDSKYEQQPCEEENLNCTECRYYDKEKHHCPRFCQVIENTVAEITSEQTRWIPCSEKMPDINIHVLAQFVMGGMAECYYAHNWWHIVGGVRISGDEVIAWMPLPQPYAESEESE